MKKKIAFIIVLAILPALFLTSCFKNAASQYCSHEWETVEVVNEGSCSEIGLKRQICKKCNEIGVLMTPAVNHQNKVYYQEKEATCTTDGNVECWFCPDCELFYSDSECTRVLDDVIIQAFYHADLTHFEENIGSCTEDGNIEYWHCNDCNINFADKNCTEVLENVIIKAKNHQNVIHHEEVLSTCLEEGNIEYYECKDCNKLYSDAQLLNEVDEVVTAKINHLNVLIYDETPSTCTRNGTLEYRHCFDCDAYLDENMEVFENIEDIKKELNKDHSFVHGVCVYCDAFDTAYTEGLVFKFDTDGYIVTNYTGTSANVLIPSYYTDGINGTKIVKEIAKDAFRKNEVVTDIEISYGVKKIDEFAFAEMPNLKSIKLPYTINSLGANIWHSCSKLEKIAYAASIDSFEAISFDVNWSEGLTDFILDFELEIEFSEINGGFQVSGLGEDTVTKDILIPDYHDGKPVILIGSEAFKNSDIECFVAGANVNAIGYQAFYRSNNLLYVDLNKVEEIDTNAFGYCDMLGKINFGTQLKIIGFYSFECCKLLQEAKLPETVSSIGYRAFSSNYSLKSINIPGNVTELDQDVFMDCYSLETVTLGEGIKEMYNTFTYCRSLKEINLPDSIEVIYPFVQYCESLEKVTFGKNIKQINIYGGLFSVCPNIKTLIVDEENPYYHSSGNAIIETASKTLVVGSTTTVIPKDGSVTKIGYGAFNGILKLKEITIPESVTFIDSYAFECSGLENINLSKNIESIGYNAFSFNQNLKTITVDKNNPKYASVNNGLIEKKTKTLILGTYKTVIPTDDSVKIIGVCAFGGSRLNQINIPLNIIEIKDGAFYQTYLKEIVIPGSVETLGDYLFGYCSYLTSVKLEEGVKVLGLTFSEAYKLETIILPSTIEEVIPSAFEHTPWFDNIPEGLLYIGKVAYYYNGQLPENSTIEFKEGTLTIGYLLFYDQKGLVKVVIPDSVENVYSYAFDECENLAEIEFGKGIKNISLKAVNTTKWYSNLPDGLIYINDVVLGCKGSYNGKTIEIKEGIKYIADYAFSRVKCNEIVLPNSIEVIGANAFENANLNKINIPEGVLTVKDYAFRFINLDEIVIPSSIQNFGLDVFENFNYLNKVSISEGRTVLPSGLLDNVRISQLILPSTLKTIESYALQDCNYISSIILPKGIESIDSYAFDGCYQLKYIYYQGTEAEWKNVKLGVNWIYNIDNLDPMYIICTDTTVVQDLQMELDSSGDFYYVVDTTSLCTQSEIVIPAEYGPEGNKKPVTEVKEDAFYCNYFITSITLPSSVTKINLHSFRHCNLLEEVNLPASITDIRVYVFSNCINLKNINFAGTVEQFKNIGCTSSGSFLEFIEENIHLYIYLETITCSDGVITITH